MKTTVEELKSMTQEDLVCLVQRLEEKIDDLEQRNKLNWDSLLNSYEKFNALSTAIQGVASLAKRIS